MKNLVTRTSALIPFSVIFFMMFSSCQKEETLLLTGDLEVTFENVQRLHYLPDIFVVGEPSLALLPNIPVVNGTMKVTELLYGNYYIKYYTSQGEGGVFTRSKMFQIKAGKTTQLIIDLNE